MSETSVAERTPLENPIDVAREFLEHEKESGANFSIKYLEGNDFEILIFEWRCDKQGKRISGKAEEYRPAEWLAKIAESCGKVTCQEEIAEVVGYIWQLKRNKYLVNQLDTTL